MMTKKTLTFLKIIFLILIATNIICTVFVLKENRAISGEDVPNHLVFSVEFFYKLSDIFHSNSIPFHKKLLSTIKLISVPMPHANGQYANFVHFPTAFFYFIFGKTLFSARLSNLLYIAILAFSVYSLGRQLGSQFIGLTSVFILLMHPFTFESSRQYGLDFPLMSVTPLIIYLILKCKNFVNLKYSILLGISIGIGILIKPQLVIFISGPIICVFYRIITFYQKHPEMDRHEFYSKVVNIITCLFIAGIISYLWWGNATPAYPVLYFRHPKFIFIRTIIFIKSFIFSFLGLPLFLLFIPSFYIFLKNKINEKCIYLAWLIGGSLFFFLFCIFFDWWNRFLMPILPVIIVIIAWGIHHLRDLKLKVITLSLVTCILCIQFYSLTYKKGDQIRKTNYSENFQDRMHIPLVFFNSTLYADLTHKEDVYKIKELVVFLKKMSLAQKIKILTVSLTPGDPRPFEMRYQARLYSRNIELLEFWCMFESAYWEFDSMDFIVFRLPDIEKYTGWPHYNDFIKLLEEAPDYYSYYLFFKTPSGEIRENLYKKLYENQSKFEFIMKIPTDMEFNWFIYKRKEQNGLQPHNISIKF